MSNKKQKNKKEVVKFTVEELNTLTELINYNLEIIGQDISNWGYKHPIDIQAWGQDVIQYGKILEKINLLKEQ